jgi:hypothetical protein
VTFFLFLCALPMLGVFPYLGPINNPNENVRTYMTMAIVERGTLRIDDMVRTFGWVNDMARVPQPPPSGTQGAAYFSVKAPATSLAGIPGYWIYSKIVAPLTGKHFPKESASGPERIAWLRNATWACRLFAVQLPCFLFVIWFERYLRAFTSDRVMRISAVAAACLGTNYLAYTHMFASHATFAIAAFGSFALTERELRLSRGDARNRRVSKAFLAGFFASWTVALEYHALPVALMLSLWGLYAFWRPTRLLAFGAGGAINAIVVMLFQWKAFGNPLTPGHKMVENARFAAEHHQGVFGILMPSWDHVKALAWDPGFGFFGTSPFMVLGLLAVPFVVFAPGAGTRRENRIKRLGALVWMLAMAGLVAVNAGFIQWRAGWTVGPRYLGAAPPFFAFGAVLALERMAGHSAARRAILRGVAGGLAFASVVTIGTVGIVYDTLPETIQRPFAQFALPMIKTAYVPHHVGEWLGIDAAWPWYVACGALLAAPLVAGLGYGVRDQGRGGVVARGVMFAAAAAFGLVPAFSKPEDGSALFVLSPDCRGFVSIWEPQGRDRISLLRIEAERYGPRRPCNWYKLADLERALGQDMQAARDETRAQGFDRDRCPRVWF